jgi:hypothetical protein
LLFLIIITRISGSKALFRGKKKRAVGRPRCRWRAIVRWILEIGCVRMVWIHLAQVRDEWRRSCEPSVSIKCCKILEQLSD